MKNIFYFILFLFLFLFLTSCENSNIDNSTKDFKYGVLLKNNNFRSENNQNTPVKKNIRDFIVTDTSMYYMWKVAGESWEWEPRIIFYKEYALYWINGQCVFWFFTFEYSDCIKLIWSYKSDCVSDIDFLEKTYNFEEYPKNRDIFANYSLLNDTVIEVKYYFPEWVDKVNLISDTIFPKHFHLYGM